MISIIIEKIFKFIWKEFIYGGHFQSLGAASIIFVSASLLNRPWSWDVLVITYFLFYPIYVYNRFKEINIDYLTNPQRTQHFKKYLKLMPWIFYFFCFITILGLIYFSNLRSLIFGLFLLFLGILYTLFFKNITKKILLFKNFYVAAFFASLVLFFILYYSYSLTYFLVISVLILMFFIFLKAFLMQIFLDVKDIESDRKEGLLTLAVLWSKEKTLKALKTLSILINIAFPIIFSIYFNIFPKTILVFILITPFNFYCFHLAKRRKYFGYVLGSGEFLLWAILIFFAKFYGI